MPQAAPPSSASSMSTRPKTGSRPSSSISAGGQEASTPSSRTKTTAMPVRPMVSPRLRGTNAATATPPSTASDCRQPGGPVAPSPPPASGGGDARNWESVSRSLIESTLDVISERILPSIEGACKEAIPQTLLSALRQGDLMESFFCEFNEFVEPLIDACLARFLHVLVQELEDRARVLTPPGGAGGPDGASQAPSFREVAMRGVPPQPARKKKTPARRQPGGSQRVAPPQATSVPDLEEGELPDTRTRDAPPPGKPAERVAATRRQQGHGWASGLSGEDALELLVSGKGPSRQLYRALYLHGVPRRPASTIRQLLVKLGADPGEVKWVSFIGEDILELVLPEDAAERLKAGLPEKLRPATDDEVAPWDPSFVASKNTHLSALERQREAFQRASHRMAAEAEACPRPSVRGWYERRLRELKAAQADLSKAPPDNQAEEGQLPVTPPRQNPDSGPTSPEIADDPPDDGDRQITMSPDEATRERGSENNPKARAGTLLLEASQADSAPGSPTVGCEASRSDG